MAQDTPPENVKSMVTSSNSPWTPVGTSDYDTTEPESYRIRAFRSNRHIPAGIMEAILRLQGFREGFLPGLKFHEMDHVENGMILSGVFDLDEGMMPVWGTFEHDVEDLELFMGGLRSGDENVQDEDDDVSDEDTDDFMRSPFLPSEGGLPGISLPTGHGSLDTDVRATDESPLGKHVEASENSTHEADELSQPARGSSYDSFGQITISPKEKPRGSRLRFVTNAEDEEGWKDEEGANRTHGQ